MITRPGCLKAILVAFVTGTIITLVFIYSVSFRKQRVIKPEAPSRYINQVRVGVTDRTTNLIFRSLNDLIKGKGYEIVLINVDDYNESWERLAAGSLDIIAAPLPEITLGIARQKPGAIIFKMISSNGADAIIAKKTSGMFEALVGKRISVVGHSSGYMFFTLLLDRIGKTVQECKIEYADSQAKALELLENGYVDAAVLRDPYIDSAVSKGFKVIASTENMPLIEEYCVAGNFIKRNYPERVKDIVKAWFELIEIQKKNPGLGKRLISRNGEISPEKLSRLMKRIKFSTLSENKEISEKELYRKILRFQKFWSLDGETNAHLNIAPDTCVDLSFVKDLNQEDIESVIINN